MTLPTAFRRLAWSNLAAQSADQIATTAAPMIAVVALGATVAETGGLAAAQTLPFLLLALPAGLLADRLPRRLVMGVAEAVRAVALAGVLAAALLGELSLSLLAVLGFVAASGTVAFSVAAPSLVSALVPSSGLAVANGRLELARSLAYAGGPALSGLLIAWSGASASFAIAVALSLAAAGLLLAIPEPPLQPAPSRHLGRDLVEGATFAWRHPLLRPILLTAVVWNLSWFLLQAAYVPYAMERLALTPSEVGLTLGCFGAGMVTGALLAPRLAALLPVGAMIAVGPLVSVLAAASLAASLWLPTGALAGLAFFLFGAGPILWTIAQTTLRQAVTPPALLGRVSAVVLMATAGARPLGAAAGGLVGSAWGSSACIALAAAGFLLQAAVILASPVPRLPALPTAGQAIRT